MRRPAMTIVEMLVVFGLIGLLSMGLFFNVRNFKRKQALLASAETLASELKRAKVFAREGRDQKAWGLEGMSDTEYSLVTRDEDGSDLVRVNYLVEPTRFAATGWSVWFDQGTGGTENAVEVVLVEPGGATVTVRVSQLGVVEQ